MLSSQDVTNGFNGIVPIVTEQGEISSLSDFHLSLKFYQDATWMVPLMSPTVEVGEPMYLAVKNHNPEGLKILVDTCFASASPDPYKKDLYYMFLLDNCPYDDTYRRLTAVDDFVKFGFLIDAFVFIQRQTQVRQKAFSNHLIFVPCTSE